MSDSPEINNIKSFGQNLTRIRKGKNLSLEALANLAEMDLSGLHRIETGKTNPKLSTIFALSKALEIGPKDLFTGDKAGI